MRHALCVATMLVAVLAGAGARARPVTIDDVLRMRFIVGIEAVPDSPDLVLQIREYHGGPRFQMDLWLAGPQGKLRRLTVGGTATGSFAVSPGGKDLAFLAERDGKYGIYVLPLDGGEARLLLGLPVHADNLRWAQGKPQRIYFTARVFPECQADFECTRRKLDRLKHGATGRIYDDLYFRPWNFWRDGRFSGLFAVDVRSGSVEPVAVGRFEVPTVPFGGKEDYSVSSDGTKVVYAAKKTRSVTELALTTNEDLYEVVGGSEVDLTSSNPAADNSPKYSPDGKYVAYLSQDQPGYESDLVRLRVYDRASQTNFTLSEILNEWVVDFVWSPDGKHIFFTVDERGYLNLYRVEARVGAVPVQVAARSVFRFLTWAGDKSRALYVTKESMTSPPDVYRLDFDRKWRLEREVRITHLNDDLLAQLDMPVVEEVWYEGAEVAGGRRQRVHAFIVKPKDASAKKKYPLVVMIHGGPQGAWHSRIHPRWTPLGIVGHGFVVAMPNPTGSTGYGQEFVKAVSKDWGGRCYQDIMAFLDYAPKIQGVDATRVCAMGGSFGGFMVNWIEGHTDRFDCLVSHDGVAEQFSDYGSTDELWFPEWDIGDVPWKNREAYARWSPLRYAENFKTPMLIIHGLNDFRVSLDQGLSMFTYLKRKGVDARLLVYPDEDHFVNKPLNRKQWYDTVVAWLRKYLYGGELPQKRHKEGRIETKKGKSGMGPRTTTVPKGAKPAPGRKKGSSGQEIELK